MATLQNFRSYELSIQFYQACKQVKLPHAMRNQLHAVADQLGAMLYKLAHRS